MGAPPRIGAEERRDAEYREAAYQHAPGRRETARRALADLVRRRPTAWRHFLLARWRTGEKEHAEAREHLLAAKDSDPARDRALEKTNALIRRVAAALRPGGRFALLDLRLPGNWLRHLAPLAVFLVRPFAVSLDVAKRRPWESVARHFARSSYRPIYFDFAYLAVGEAPAANVSSMAQNKETMP